MKALMFSGILLMVANTAHAYPEDGHRGYFMHGEWGMMGPFMMLIPIAILALFVWFIIKIIAGKNNTGSADQAMSILRERFAKGEIDQQEFESRKRQLEHPDQ